jgi:hypothetical protein
MFDVSLDEETNKFISDGKRGLSDTSQPPLVCLFYEYIFPELSKLRVQWRHGVKVSLKGTGLYSRRVIRTMLAAGGNCFYTSRWAFI